MARKEAEAYIISAVKDITGSEKNAEIYRNKFKNMSNKQFEQYMSDIENDITRLCVWVPNGSTEASLSVERNKKLSEKYGIATNHHAVVYDDPVRGTYKSKLESKTMFMPFRRTSQLLSKKISIPKDGNTRNTLTGQVTGDSKGGKLTPPELEIIGGLGAQDSLVELMKFRGGDLGSLAATYALIETYGEARHEDIFPHSTGVVSKNTLKAYLNGMMLTSNL